MFLTVGTRGMKFLYRVNMVLLVAVTLSVSVIEADILQGGYTMLPQGQSIAGTIGKQTITKTGIQCSIR